MPRDSAGLNHQVSLDARSRSLSALRRMVVACGVAIAILVVGRVAFMSLELRHQTIADAERNLTTVSKITAEQLSQTISAVDLLTRSIQESVTRPSLPDQASLHERAGTPSFQAALKGWQMLLPQVEAASVVDAAGDIIANTRQFPSARYNIDGAPFFQALKDDPDRGLVLADPIALPTNGEWVLFLARAFKDEAGHFAGIVLAGMPVAYFERYFSVVDVGQGTSVALDARDGTLIGRWPRDENAISKTLPPLLEPVRYPSDNDTVINRGRGVDGAKRIFAMTQIRIQGSPLLLSVSQPKSDILKSWRMNLFWGGGSSIILFLAIILLVNLLVRAFRLEELGRAEAAERETRLSAQAMELAAARDLAQAANRARGEFLANVSHELRTPLNAILGFSEILQKELFGPIGDARYREFIVDIHDSGRHLLEVIGNILDLTKVDAGRLALDERDVDVADMIQLCLKLVQDGADNGKVQLEAVYPRGRCLLWCDPTRLKQILLNLLSNAVKFTPEGGKVTLTTSVTDDSFILTVADTGIGMSPEDLQEAMQPFHQIDSSLSRRYQGTGLGLPLTKSLVELHDGTLEIRSRPGIGTVADVRLPKSRLMP
jgi:signal transduction histidine kinase